MHALEFPETHRIGERSLRLTDAVQRARLDEGLRGFADHREAVLVRCRDGERHPATDAVAEQDVSIDAERGAQGGEVARRFLVDEIRARDGGASRGTTEAEAVVGQHRPLQALRQLLREIAPEFDAAQ